MKFIRLTWLMNDGKLATQTLINIDDIQYIQSSAKGGSEITFKADDSFILVMESLSEIESSLKVHGLFVRMPPAEDTAL